MRIWCQRAGGISSDPMWKDFDLGLRKHARTVGRPDTVVDQYSQESSIVGIDQYRASLNVAIVQSIKTAIRAEREGYDAFLMVSTADAGFYEIREVVDIPVVFMLENTLHFASMFSPTFAFIAHGDRILTLLTQKAKEYGLAENLTPSGHLGLTYKDWENLYAHPEQYMDAVTKKAKEIAANGARLLIPVALPFSIWCVQQGIREIAGVPLLDGYGCAVKMTELMVDLKKLGITRNKYGPAQKDVLEAIQQMYVPK